MIFAERRWLFLGGFLVVLGGCYAKGEPYVEPDTAVCAPLEFVEEPVELGTVIGIGEAADGTLYLVDRVEASLRVFVSRGEELERVRVTGEGQLYDPSYETNLALFEYEGTTLTIGVEVRDGATRIALGPGSVRSFEELLASGEELSVAPDDVLDDYVLRNLPGDIEIEYIARVETGASLVVIRPSGDFTYDDFRLFIGDGERLVERQIQSVVRARDGGSTWIRFDYHGEVAEVAFPISEPASLTTGSGTYSLEPLPSEGVGTFSFECLENRMPTNSPPPDGGA